MNTLNTHALPTELNDGTFEGTTLAGRMTKMLSGEAPITFQMLSFG